MFWGLIMEPQKRYTQVIKKAFHISMASLDVSNTDGEPSQIMCGYEGRNYLLCTLRKPDMLQCSLDLYFEEGTTVSFATNGKSLVHLTGYLTKEDPDEEFDGESDEETEEFEVKAQKKPRSNDNETSQPSKKKAKKSEQVEEEESDDSDFDLDKLMEAEEQSEEESGEEEESGLDDDEEVDESGGEEEEDEDDDEEEDDEEEDEDVPKGKVVMNGLDKKSKTPKKDVQKETPKSDKKGKDKKQLQLTPGPKKNKENGDSVESKQKVKKDKTQKEGQTPNSKKKTLPGGVIVEDLKEGQGDSAGNGKFVHVYYEGRLKSNNKVFDKTQNGPGFGFRLGKGEVIKGWDIGVSGMKVGGKRRITCPPHLAYGPKGSPPVIPPNSTLVFEVELKKVK